MKIKQNLEDFVRPIKSLDRAILKQYTKLGKKWEDKGYSRYSLAHGFSLSGYGGGIPFWIAMNTGYWGGIGGALGLLFGMDFGRNIHPPHYEKDVTDERAVTELYPMHLAVIKKITDSTRLPLFLSGAGLMSKGIYDMVNHFTKGGGDLSNTFFELSMGYSLFGLASSIYIKDMNPKLLEKEPAWKRAYNSLKEKVKDLIPKPTPQPVPVRNYHSK